MPGFFHRLIASIIEKDLPKILREKGAAAGEAAVSYLKQKHANSPEQYAHTLKAAYNGLMIFEDAVAKSPTEFDDAGLAIFIDAIREAAAADNIEL